MPKHYIIAKNIKRGGWILKTHEEWLSFKWCAKEDLQPEWEQVGLYFDYWEAMNALFKEVKSRLDTHYLT